MLLSLPPSYQPANFGPNDDFGSLNKQRKDKPFESRVSNFQVFCILIILYWRYCLELCVGVDCQGCWCDHGALLGQHHAE